jgi:transcriptional regulator with XRE-family HTH domain
MTGAEPGIPRAIDVNTVSALMIFSAELRAQRQRIGWTQITLGGKIGYSGSFVSDVERCARTPAIDFARSCDRELGLPGTLARIYDLIRRDAYPSGVFPVASFEREAVRIHEWEMRVVPALLQTPGYARAVVRAARPNDSDEEVACQVAARLGRQELLSGEHPPMLWYVLHEGVVRQAIGGAAVMGEQLGRLIELAGMPRMVLQILPFSAADNAGASGPITVFEFAGAPTVCYTECYGGGRVVEGYGEVADLVTAVNMVRASALCPGESIRLLRAVRLECGGR